MKGAPIDYVIIFVYFIAILGFGAFFGKYTKSTKDFFFGGQRFSWWLIAMSLVATTVGSYSFVKYSRMAYAHGFSCTQTYLNDWFWMPLFLFGWLPIVYYSRVVSIPEYFDRRFNRTVRFITTFLILIYMVGYVGINFFTMGKALNALLGWPVFTGALVVAAIAAVYVTAGGQTSVIMTDLVQGFLLLIAGLFLVLAGINAVGGFSTFWSVLPPDHRHALAHFNSPSDFNFVGIFWQDGIANGIAAYFFNQGMIMRFLSARNVEHGRKAVVVMVLMLMPIAAIAVGGAGWIGRAMATVGLPLDNYSPEDVFVTVSLALCKPGVFGLIMAAMTAALMSTADTLINAISAITVNDVIKPLSKKQRSDKFYLAAARGVSVLAAVLGMALVPIYMEFGSIYAAHGAFTAAVAPPMAVTLLLGAIWKRFSSKAAICSMIGGMIAIALSFAFPELIDPIANLHGMHRIEEGFRAYKYIRALYGVSITSIIAIISAFIFKPDKKPSELIGLVWGTIEEAKRRFKGGEPNEVPGKVVRIKVRVTSEETLVRVPRWAMEAMKANPGDLCLVSHKNRIYAGLRSAHARLGEPIDAEFAIIPESVIEQASIKGESEVTIEKIL